MFKRRKARKLMEKIHELSSYGLEICSDGTICFNKEMSKRLLYKPGHKKKKNYELYEYGKRIGMLWMINELFGMRGTKK